MRLALALAAGPLALPAAAGELALRYDLCLELGQPPRVAVTLEIDGLEPEREELRLSMMEGFAFARLPDPLLGGSLAARAGDAVLEIERESSHAWTVATGGAPSLVVEYELPLTHRSQPAVAGRDEYEYPYAEDDHGMLVTGALLVAPEHADVGRATARLRVPEGWDVVAPWPRLADGSFEPGDALWNDLVAVGAWQVRSIAVGDFTATVAVAPGQGRLLEVVAAPIERIVAAELELFGREPEGDYLFLFGKAPVQGFAGSPKTSSMTLAVGGSDADVARRYVPHLVAHEFFHTWAASTARLADDVRWLNEGVTDYFAYLVAARVELTTWSDFASALAERMKAAATSPLAGTESLAAAGGPAFFEGGAAYELVYAGGLVVGAWLDRALRADHDATLAEVLRAFLNAPRSSPSERATLDDWLATLAACSDDHLAARVRALVTRPVALDPVALLAEAGVAVERIVTPPRLDLRANLDGARVVDVDPRGLAGRLGVRAGDCFRRVNGRDVATPDEIHAAWRAPRDGRMRAELDRAGERVMIDAALEDDISFRVSADGWY